MLTSDTTLIYIYIIFISVSLSTGMAAIYFWVRVHLETQNGSIAWLLLALTAVFLITTSIFSSVAVSNSDPLITETILIFMGFWGAVYTTIFAAAGFIMFNAFRTIPRAKLGDFLLEGMVFQKGHILKTACGKNCSVCEKYSIEECQGCIPGNKDGEAGCPIYECVVEKGMTSCMDCDSNSDCSTYSCEIVQCPLNNDTDTLPEFEQTAGIFKRSTLLEYNPHARYEDAVIEVCLRLYGEMVNTVLVSTQPRTSLYREKLGDLIDVGAMKFIEISSTAKTVSEENGIIKLPVTELEKFFDLTAKLPKDCAVIFEPVTQLIVTEGETKAYEFVSGMAERFDSSELMLIGLINATAHEERTVSRFEGLFLNLAELDRSRIRIVKGGKEEYVRFFVGEKFYMEEAENH
ncbi:DUF3795 domain-containing protein [Methanolobus halotolerans]|uniref:DUF835 domain-containing protein n=1 Tax=Methanolobus halotolerans TaxID=2052935 RepID=A0A4E0Q750_9EURY|nr:DUF3795 domain-containing protein [Methanolobus halotolerans]TGC10717.1 hypothetical protein CUN85_04415 [Methanolobus halotolerans]